MVVGWELSGISAIVFSLGSAKPELAFVPIIQMRKIEPQSQEVTSWRWWPWQVALRGRVPRICPSPRDLGEDPLGTLLKEGILLSRWLSLNHSSALKW